MLGFPENSFQAILFRIDEQNGLTEGEGVYGEGEVAAFFKDEKKPGDGRAFFAQCASTEDRGHRRV